MITSVTTSGLEIMITCEPSASVIVAPARSAIERIRSVPAARSGLASTVQEGSDFQAGRLGSIPAVHNTPTTVVESRQEPPAQD